MKMPACENGTRKVMKSLKKKAKHKKYNHEH